jgi:hypothetical protein
VEHVGPNGITARICALEEGNYSIHFHVWTPDEFSALLTYARDQEQLPMAVETVRENEHEFIAILRRC